MSIRRLDFDITFDGEHTRCRLLSDFGAGVVEEHWEGLYQAYTGDHDRNPYFTHAVNNNNREEVGVYLGLAWAVTASLERFALPTHALESVRMWFDREDFELVRWDYRTKADETDWSRRSGQFVRASYPVDRDDLRGPTSPGAGNPAGLFPVGTRRELVDLMVCALGDAWATLVVFGTSVSASRPLVKRLRDRKPPTMAHLLEEGEVAVVITVGVDLGYFDSVEVVAPGDRCNEFEAIFETFRGRISTYEKTIESIRSMDDFLVALDILEGRRSQGGSPGL